MASGGRLNVMTIPGTGSIRRSPRRAVLCIAAIALLGACEPDGSGPPADKPAERQKIIVEFAVPAETAGRTGISGNGAEALRMTAESILSRLDPEIRKSARIFEQLPVMALEADAATLARLMRMPEVVSIASDREVGLREPAGGLAPSK